MSDNQIEITDAKFRDQLQKIMPGYKWTVHKPHLPKSMMEPTDVKFATGIQSNGFNRISTLEIEVRSGVYTAKSAGTGKRAGWLGSATGATLAQALRNLQNFYERNAQKHQNHYSALVRGRTAPRITIRSIEDADHPSSGMLTLVLRETGFGICGYGPHEDSECGHCHRTGRQLYTRSTGPFPEDSDLRCGSCVVEDYQEGRLRL